MNNNNLDFDDLFNINSQGSHPIKKDDGEAEVIYQPTKRGRKKSTKAKIGKYFELTDDVIQTLQMLANHYHLNMTSALSKIILSHQKIIEDNQRTHEIEKTKITNYEKNIESLVRQMAAMEDELKLLSRSLGQLDQMDIGERLNQVEKQNLSLDTTQQQLIKDLIDDSRVAKQGIIGGEKEEIVLATISEKWRKDKLSKRGVRLETRKD